MKKIKLKINKPLRNYRANTIITIKIISDDLPKDVYWRNRLKDAEFDNCVSIIKKHNKNDIKKIKIDHENKLNNGEKK